MLRTKCIKALASPEDGIRISVMSRHTLEDGVMPDPEIRPESFDQWWPELAPPPCLVGAYYKRGLSWEDFTEGFNEHLLSTEEKLRELVAMARYDTVTIMCVEVSPKHCHRRLIAEACQNMCPDLEVSIE